MGPLRVVASLGALLGGAVGCTVFGAAVLVGGRGVADAGTGILSGPSAVASAAAAGATGAPSAAAGVAVAWALARVGTPYRWGGTGPAAFDCSGLTQAAYGAAGVRIPRVAQDQYDAGPSVAPGAALVPGDLVFFGVSPRAVTHVGMDVGGGEMVDAPHTGAKVRVEQVPAADFVGATRPAG